MKSLTEMCNCTILNLLLDLLRINLMPPLTALLCPLLGSQVLALQYVHRMIPRWAYTGHDRARAEIWKVKCAFS